MDGKIRWFVITEHTFPVEFCFVLKNPWNTLLMLDKLVAHFCFVLFRAPKCKDQILFN